jgi:hypothetical protein
VRHWISTAFHWQRKLYFKAGEGVDRVRQLLPLGKGRFAQVRTYLFWGREVRRRVGEDCPESAFGVTSALACAAMT